ncbi:hypothetical protein PR048_027505 [Dryococelus australis]|uniref:Uncharacterized protein n=1 Tax=Dryococelus australis TaxID=614101 RepID=A0ABQ9GGQ6_9NEOP|nr:hypothetical protein PR048_027505 [Dryococelus australis]
MLLIDCGFPASVVTSPNVAFRCGYVDTGEAGSAALRTSSLLNQRHSLLFQFAVGCHLRNMSSSSDEEFLLLVNACNRIPMECTGIQEINRGRYRYGEYHLLFGELRNELQRFFQYTYMTIETFDYILAKTEDRLMNNWCNWHTQPTTPKESLVITLRVVVFTSATFPSGFCGCWHIRARLVPTVLVGFIFSSLFIINEVIPIICR